ncbi:MAG: gamma-glutamyltransferase [Candidatus Aminicenantia bacterium]
MKYLISILIFISVLTSLIFGYENGVVVSDSEIASSIGVDILKQGGNAIDAAVAVGFALAVAYPQAGNLGGGGFMIIRLKNGEAVMIDYRERAPLAAYRDMYLDDKGEVIPDLSLLGYKAAGVPGTVAGLILALEKYGTMSLDRILKPVIELAEKGFRINFRLAQDLARAEDLLSQFPESKRIFLNNGYLYKTGDILVQKDLAYTLKLIAEKGKKGFYQGEIAELIEKDMKQNGGLITKKDLASYQAVLREPIIGRYRDYQIISSSPPSSGGIVLIEMLNILEKFPLKKWGWRSPKTIHIIVEAMKRAYADRAKYLGDPDFIDMPKKGLISKKYAEELVKTINLTFTQPSQEISKIDPYHFEHSETTHYSIADKEGNVVSNAYTINGFFGCGVTIPGTGFLLNNEMDDFSLKPGYPNIYGLVGNQVNSIAPGKRMLSSMTPTIVLKNGRPFLVIGSPGGSTIINTVLQVIINIIDFQMDLGEAITAPRMHHQWLPDAIQAEKGRWGNKVYQQLIKMGHKIKYRTFIGNTHGILFKDDGQVIGFADPRRAGKACGF